MKNLALKYYNDSLAAAKIAEIERLKKEKLIKYPVPYNVGDTLYAYKNITNYKEFPQFNELVRIEMGQPVIFVDYFGKVNEYYKVSCDKCGDKIGFIPKDDLKTKVDLLLYKQELAR
jgi:hypothetical protein